MDPDMVPREQYDLVLKAVYILGSVIVTLFTAGLTMVRADRARSIEERQKSAEDHRRKDEMIATLNERLSALEARGA